MATIKDIANRLGVAVSTVSKGLNGASDISDEMRQLVLDTAVEMGYISKKLNASGKRKICVFIENMDYENIDQFGYEIIVGFKLAAARRHWDITVVPTNLKLQSTEKYDSYMLKNGFCGGFLLGFTLHDSWISQLSKTQIPTVLFDNSIIGNEHVGYVGTDNHEGIDHGIKHLTSLGHKKIAFLNGSKNSMVSQKRNAAFCESLRTYDIPVHEDLIVYSDYSFHAAKEFIPGFIQNGATAIMCSSDIMAAGSIAEVTKMGLRIPDDISIIGYDDLPIAAQLTPALTTIRQDRIELGKSAFLLLYGLVHKISISKILLRAKFIERDSTGPVKNTEQIN